MRDQETNLSVIKDSAIIITGFSVVLFLWGYLAEALGTVAKGIPLDFSPDRTIQEYILLGGFIALIFFLPIAFVIYLAFIVLDSLLKGKIKKIFRFIQSKGVVFSGLYYLMVFSLSVYLLVPLTKYTNRPSGHKGPQVKSITLSPESNVTNTYEGLFFITKKGSNYIFADKPSEGAGIVYILNESEIKELVLTVVGP